MQHAPDAQLDGKVAIISMIRDADDAVATFRSELHDGKRLSGGDMLSGKSACVRAEVYVIDTATNRRGRVTSTDRVCP